VKKKLKRTGLFCVYILECKNGTYYTGYSSDLDKRIKEHNNSSRGAKSLRGKVPVKVVWKKEYKYRHYAMSAEYKIKQLNRRQKELLVGGMRLDKVFSRKRW
jgi:putative endonuclease